MQATARRLSVLYSKSTPRRRLIRDVAPTNEVHRHMNIDEFWASIARIDIRSLRRGDEDGAVAPLISALSKLPESELQSFGEHLAKTLYDIDGRVYADQSGESSDSDDAFLYARLFVVACGRKHYDAVRADPTLMPKTLDEWCESLHSVHWYAWASQTGAEPSDWPHLTEYCYETGSNDSLWNQ